jgi:hypothetical protein
MKFNTISGKIQNVQNIKNKILLDKLKIKIKKHQKLNFT